MSLSDFLLGNVTSASYSGLTLQGIIGAFALMVLGVLVVDLKKHSDPVQTYQLMEIPLFFQHCHQ